MRQNYNNKQLSQACIIVVPTYKTFEQLNADELVSWRQCLKILAAYPICVACPDDMDTSGFVADLVDKGIHYELQKFSPTAFASIDGYNQLMLSREFYKRFVDYEYLLTYQLDAFIFQDDLAYWCELGYSYIGAPWFKGFIPTDNQAQLWKVGNGGFTLRKVANCLRVLHTFSMLISWRQLINEYWGGRLGSLKSYYALGRSLLIGNNSHWRFNDYANYRHCHQEDYFWGVLCSDKFNWFRVPTAQKALQFSFEFNPRRMYELNDFQLPMGCHAWEKYDRPFWEPFIASFS